MEEQFANRIARMKRHSWKRVFILFLLLCGSFSFAEKPRTFTIIQMNDVYEVFPIPSLTGGPPAGGLAYASTLIQQQRNKGPVLLLNAGDFLSPSLLSIRLKHKGSQMIQIMNAMHMGMVTFGNHEFDLGCQVLADRIRESDFPWVSANVDLPREMNLPPGKFAPYYIISVAGLRVGIFGLTVPQQPVPGCGGTTPIVFNDPLQSAQKVIPKLKSQHVDLIIALTHLRITQDQALAAKFPDIDFIVGGHEHEVIVTTVGKTLITKAGQNAVGLGLVGVKALHSDTGWVVEKSWNREMVDPEHVKADPRIETLLAPWRKEMEPFSAVIGETTVPLDIREEVVRDGESNFADYIADLMREELNTDAALFNGGSFRDDRVVPAGKLTMSDLYTMMPFENQIVSINITGQQLWTALENGVSLAGQKAGRFPQISGMSFAFDPKKPVGQRVTGVWVGKNPIDLSKDYSLATTEFLLQRGSIDGYTLPQQVLRTGGDLHELIIRNFLKGPIQPVVEGRVVRQ